MWRAILAKRLALLAAFTAAWELAGGGLVRGFELVDPFFISRPSLILGDLVTGLRTGRLLIDTGVTLLESLISLVVGTLTGTLAGLVFAFWKGLDDVAEPFMSALNALPRPALAPLAVLWLGLGIWSKVFVGWSLVFFVMFYNVYYGIKTIDQDVVNALRVMKATRLQMVRIVILPAVFSWIFAGLRVSVSYALIGAIIGEFVGATAGLGYQLVTAQGLLQIERLYSALVLTAVAAVGVSSAARRVEARLLKWRPTVHV